MKANDLMVGDLLRVNSDNTCITRDTIVTVRAIDEDIRQASHIGCAFCSPLDDRQIGEEIWCDYLDPIPLTPEILEKNGFTKVNSQRYEWGSLEDAEYININPKKGIIHINGKNRSNANLYGQFSVHELQHALRLCGIDKEIVL